MRILKLTLLVFIFSIVGCSSTGTARLAGEVGSTGPNINVSRQIIATANLTLSVQDVEQEVTAVSDLVESYGGHVQSNRYSEKTARLSLRVPSEDLDPFLQELSLLGEVTARSTSSRDVTEQLIDLDARLDNLIVLRARYRELLEQANTVDEILSIEKELSTVQTEIDSIEGRRKSLADQVALSTVELRLEQRRILGPLGYVGKGLAWTIGKLFFIR